MSVSVESTINKDIKSKKIVETRHKNYILFGEKQPDELITQLNDIDNKIDEYLNAIQNAGKQNRQVNLVIKKL